MNSSKYFCCNCYLNRNHLFKTLFVVIFVKSDDLKDLAFKAIVKNRVEFVKFFLEIRLRLSELLEKDKINEIYKKVKTISFAICPQDLNENDVSHHYQTSSVVQDKF